jgi:hypothetical protein
MLHVIMLKLCVIMLIVLILSVVILIVLNDSMIGSKEDDSKLF